MREASAALLAMHQRLEAQLAERLRMEGMIREILDYAATSRSEAAERVDVAALVEGLLPDADATGASIRFCGSHGIEARLPPVKAGRIVTDLIDNAVRYASDVEVSVRRDLDDLTIVVADRGPGIAEADLARMLEPFVRGDTSRSRRTGGTGFGLAISRDLAVDLGGSLVLKARPGGGLTAELRLHPDRD